MITISELRAMSVKHLLKFRLNLINGLPKDFNEFTVFVIDKILEEKKFIRRKK